MARERGLAVCTRWIPRFNRPVGTGALLLLILVLAIPDSARAAPSNDNFADRIVLSGDPVTVDGTTSEATQEAGEPAPSYYDLRGYYSVWYSWTSPSDRTVEFSIPAANPNLAVFTGTDLTSLSLVASSNVYSGGRVRFHAESGTTYQIQVAAIYQSYSIYGLGPFRLTAKSLPPPTNDNFADSIALSGPSPATSGTTVSARTESGEPETGGGGFTVWYSWTAAASSTVSATADGSDEYTLLAVFTGDSIGSLVPVLNEAVWGGFRFQAIAGTTYRISIDTEPEGTYQFSLFSERPSNDDRADAIPLAGEFASASGATYLATPEDGEPNYEPEFVARSVWYSWIAPATGRFRVITFTKPNYYYYYGDMDLVLYTVDESGSLVFASYGYGHMDFEATAGTAYRFSATSYLYSAGSHFTLTLRPLPRNDSFAEATVLEGFPATATGSILDATREEGEPRPGPALQGATSWWEWTAPVSGPVLVATTGSDFDTALGIYTGSSVSTLVRVAWNDNTASSPASKVSFEAEAGTTYRIQVSDGAEAYYGYNGSLVRLTIASATAALAGPPSATPNPAVVGVPVRFTTDPTLPGSYTWDFGDGTVLTTTAASLDHTYAASGSYAVRLTAGRPFGTTGTSGFTLQVLPNAVQFTSSLSVDPQPARTGTAVRFSVTTSEAADYSWDFGDGTLLATTSASVEHTYAAAGTYPVSVSASSPGGTPVTASGPLQVLEGRPLAVTRLRVTLHFQDPASDSVLLTGTLPLPAGTTLDGETASIDVGGIQRAFVLDRTGAGETEDGSLRILPEAGWRAARNLGFTMRLRGGTYQELLRDEGLDDARNDRKPVLVEVVVRIGDVEYRTTVQVFYSSRKGDHGWTR